MNKINSYIVAKYQTTLYIRIRYRYIFIIENSSSLLW